MVPADKIAIGKTKLKVTRLGLGTGLLGAVHDDEAWNEIIKTALAAGVRCFDTSPYYGFGTSEVRLGRTLAKYDRREYVISTKVGRLLRADAPEDPFAEAVYFPKGRPAGALRSVYDYSATATRQSLVESRERLGLEHIDIAHIHDIVELASGVSHVKEAIEETYPVLAELRDEGVITAAGVGAQVNQVLIDLGESCSFDCFLIAGRYTLLDQSALDEVLPLCVRKTISVIIGSPYNTGILHDPKPGLDVRLHAGTAGDGREGAEAEGHLREIQGSPAGGGYPVSLRASGGGADTYRRALGERDRGEILGRCRRLSHPNCGEKCAKRASSIRTLLYQRKAAIGAGGRRRRSFADASSILRVNRILRPNPWAEIL